MDYKLVSFIIMLVTFISYVSFIWIKYGAQKSISMSYYSLSQNARPLFTLFCWFFAIPAIIIGETALMFFAGAGIAFVGAACQIKEKFTKKVHVTAATIGIISSQLAIILNYHMWYVTVVFVLLSLPFVIFSKNHRIWWTEIFAFISISYVLAFLIF